MVSPTRGSNPTAKVLRTAKNVQPGPLRIFPRRQHPESPTERKLLCIKEFVCSWVVLGPCQSSWKQTCDKHSRETRRKPPGLYVEILRRELACVTAYSVTRFVVRRGPCMAL